MILIHLVQSILFSWVVIRHTLVPDVSITSTTSSGKKLVCYVGTWATYRPGNGKFEVEDIDPFMCTHAMYGFAKLENNQIASFDPWQDLYDNYGKGGYTRFTNLKQKNPNLKTLLAIGGWNEGSDKYSTMAGSATNRQTFVNSVVPFLKKYNFDGLDLDWEYPTQRGGRPEDRENFSLLVSELKVALSAEGLLLTAAVTPNPATAAVAYEVPKIAKDLDFINVMCYDYHGYWADHYFTGHNTPLYEHPLDNSKGFKDFNVNATVHYYLQAGLPKEKLIMGMALYGRGFLLDDPSQNGLYAPASNGIPAGPYTQQAGTWGYNEICEKFGETGKWPTVVDPTVLAPYSYSGANWIGYDDTSSLYTKTKFALDLDLGGAMVWSLETDDFRGICQNSRQYILTNTIKETLNGGGPPSKFSQRRL